MGCAVSAPSPVDKFVGARSEDPTQRSQKGDAAPLRDGGFAGRADERDDAAIGRVPSLTTVSQLSDECAPPPQLTRL